MGVWGRMEVTVVVLFEVNWCDIFRFVEDRGVYENLTRASFCNDTPCKEILGLHTKVTADFRQNQSRVESRCFWVPDVRDRFLGRKNRRFILSSLTVPLDRIGNGPPTHRHNHHSSFLGHPPPRGQQQQQQRRHDPPPTHPLPSCGVGVVDRPRFIVVVVVVRL